MADKTICMPEIQFLFLKPWNRSLHQSLGPDMYFQRACSGAVQTKLRNQNHLKFIDPELKLTLVHVARNWSRNQKHRSFYSTTESKSQSGYFPGAGVASKQISVNQYGAGTKA